MPFSSGDGGDEFGGARFWWGRLPLKRTRSLATEGMVTQREEKEDQIRFLPAYRGWFS